MPVFIPEVIEKGKPTLEKNMMYMQVLGGPTPRTLSTLAQENDAANFIPS